MIFIQCCQPVSSFSLSDLSDISQAIIAVANLFLAGYVLFYQIRKDKQIDFETARLNEQNIKLQWFKELVVQPNIASIALFYSNLHTIKSKINAANLSNDEKLIINDFVKEESAKLRKSFIDVLLHIDRNFYDKVMQNIDELVDSITNAIFNDDLKLDKTSVYDKHIGSQISYSKNKLISLLYNYKGLSV